MVVRSHMRVSTCECPPRGYACVRKCVRSCSCVCVIVCVLCMYGVVWCACVQAGTTHSPPALHTHSKTVFTCATIAAAPGRPPPTAWCRALAMLPPVLLPWPAASCKSVGADSTHCLRSPDKAMAGGCGLHCAHPGPPQPCPTGGVHHADSDIRRLHNQNGALTPTCTANARTPSVWMNILCTIIATFRSGPRHALSVPHPVQPDAEIQV